MSLSEPLAWPFRPEQLEALAARIREWNGAVFPVAPPRWTWNSAGGGLRELAPAPAAPDAGPVAIEVTSDLSPSDTGDTDPDEFSPVSEVNVDPAGAPVVVTTELPPAGFSSVVDDVYANAQSRSVSFDSMSDAWTDGGHSETSPSPSPSEAKPFVPAFERDDEDDSELDIKPSDRARLETESAPETPSAGSADGDKDDDEEEEDGWNV